MTDANTAEVKVLPKPDPSPKAGAFTAWCSSQIAHEHSVAVALREGYAAIINDCVNNHDNTWTAEHDAKVVALLQRVRDSGWTP